MIKKFIALSLAVLVMASHMVSTYALTNSTNLSGTDNGVTGEIGYTASDPNYKTFWASTSAVSENQIFGYIYADILLENADNDAYIKSNWADGHRLHSLQTTASVTYGHAERVKVTGTHIAGNSETNLRANFSIHKTFAM